MVERLAIISDIHANLEALEAVLADIDARGASETLCLGDIVGYGVDAEACVDLIRKRCSLCLCGNHDWALVNTTIGFNAMARRALEYTRDRMEPRRFAGRKRRERWEFIKNLPTTQPRGDWLLVHGSPRDPVMEYIFPEDVDIASEKMSEIFGKFEKVCFVGHTHLPGIFTDDMRFQTPAELGNSFLLGGSKAVVNVGSVGQPRDGDVRACYVQVGEGLVVYRRIEYDIQKTMEKIRASGTDPLCAERLALGK